MRKKQTIFYISHLSHENVQYHIGCNMKNELTKEKEEKNQGL